MKMITELKNLPRENWLLFWTTIINRFGSMAIYLLIVYLSQGLGLSLGVSGLIVGIYGFGCLIGSLLGGFFTDRIGAFWVMCLALIVSGSIMLVYPWVHNVAFLSILSFLWGAFGECYRPANQVAIHYFCSPAQVKTAFALNRWSINLGMSIAPVIGGFLAKINFKFVFVVDAITTLSAGVFLFIVFKSYFKLKNLPQSITPPRFSAFLLVAKDKRMLYPMFAYVLLMIIFFQYNTTLPIFMIEYLQSAASTFGLLCSINALMIILFEVPLNIYISSWKSWAALTWGAILIGIGFGFNMQVETVTGCILGSIIWTVGEMILFPSMSTYIMEIAPVDKRGMYMGVYSMVSSFALIVAPILGVQVYQLMGPKLFWLACFLVCGIAGIMFYFLKKMGDQDLNLSPVLEANSTSMQL